MKNEWYLIIGDHGRLKLACEIMNAHELKSILVTTVSDASVILKQHYNFVSIICDSERWKEQDSNLLEFLDECKEQKPNANLIVISGEPLQFQNNVKVIQYPQINITNFENILESHLTA